MAFFGMDHPENEEMPYRRHFPSHVDLYRNKGAAASRMMWSASARSGGFRARP